MTGTVIAILIIASLMSAVDWIAVARDSTWLEYVSKPAATIAFLIVVATLDVPHDLAWSLLLVAFVFCLAGDVFLMLPINAFVPGLASFALAQVLFAITFFGANINWSRFIAGLFLTVPVAGLLARRFITAMRVAGLNALVLPVSVYVVVISSMALGAIASGSVVAIAGAVSFMISDSLIAERRFVNEQKWHPVAIMVTYHFALAGLALSLL